MPSSCPFAPFLNAAGSVVLDGGLTTSLPKVCEKHFLWGGQLLFGLDGGLDCLKGVHRQHLEGGADIIGSQTYKLSQEMFDSLKEHCLLDKIPNGSETRVEDLFHRAIGAAKAARDEFWAANRDSTRIRPLVFASCGPYLDQFMYKGATDPNANSDGSENVAALEEYYRRKLAMIKAAQPDGVAIETLAGSREAVVAAKALEAAGMVGWICFICKDNKRTNSGELFADCIKALEPFPNVRAVGVNCTDPKYVNDLVAVAKDNTSKFVAVYPNSGEVWNAAEGHRCWGGEENMKYLTGEDACGFCEAGADLIGGCCRVMPNQLKLFRDSLRERWYDVNSGGRTDMQTGARIIAAPAQSKF